MATIDELLQQATSLEQQYSTPASEPLSPVGQAIATGSALPSYGTPRFTPFEAQTYQKMTPLSGALMTPANFLDLPAEQRSALELESVLRQKAQKDTYQAELEKLKRRDAYTAFGLNAADAMALGFGTELAAAGEAALSPDKTYGDVIREYGTAKQRLYETNPYASTAGAITGSVLPTLLTAGTMIGGAAQAGRTVPTLAEQLIGGVTSSEIKAAAGIADTATKAAKLKELMKIGALQGALTGVGTAEPTEGMSTEQGLLSRALGGTVGAVGGVVGVPIGIGVTKTGQALLSPKKTIASVAKRLGLSELTDQETSAAVANIAESVGLTEPKLIAARQAAAESGNPLMQHATTDELVQVPGISTLRDIAQSRSQAGSEGFWGKEQQQLAAIKQNLQGAVDNIDMSTPEAALQAQEKSQRFINLRQRELHKVGNEMYSDLPDGVQYSRSDLTKKLGDLYQSMFSPAKGQVSKDIQYAFDFLSKRLYQEAGPLSRRVFGKTEGTQPTITGRELIDLRSGLLQAGRDLAEKDPRQAILANELGKVVHEFIQTDPKLGPQYVKANDFWSNLIDTYHSGPLSNVYNKKIVSLDNFAEEITRNVERWKQFQAQTGFNPKTFKEQLAIQFQKFTEAGADAGSMLQTVNAKLKYLDDMSKLMYKSPIDSKLKETYNLAKQSLTHIKEFLQTAKSARDLVPPGMTPEMLKTGSIEDMALIAATANEKTGGAPAQAFKAALRQFIRDKGRQGLSRVLGGVTLGAGAAGLGTYGYYKSDTPLGKIASVAAGATGAMGLALGGLKYNRVAAQNVLKLNEALVGALKNPELMQKAFDARNVIAATKSAGPQGIINALSKTLPGKTALRTGTAAVGAASSGVANKVANMGTGQKPKEKVDINALLDQAKSLEGQYATPTPTPQGKSLGARVSDMLVTPAEAETRRKESSAEKYLSTRPPIIRAIAEVESSVNKHKSVSPKGAVGRMQLMGPAAKEVGVNRKDPLSNVKGGEMYFNKMLDRFGNYGKEFALAGYNWGQGNLSKAISTVKNKGLSVTWNNIVDNVYVPAETQNYVKKVLSLERKFRG